MKTHLGKHQEVDNFITLEQHASLGTARILFPILENLELDEKQHPNRKLIFIIVNNS